MAVELQFIVTLQADWDVIDVDDDTLYAAAAEAIQNVIELGEESGFSHSLADEVSLGFVGIQAVRKQPAPDLLEATKSLFEHCVMVHKHWGDGGNQKEAHAAIAAARAAIAKATA